MGVFAMQKILRICFLSLICVLASLTVQAKTLIFSGSPIEVYLAPNAKNAATVLQFAEPQRIGVTGGMAKLLTIRPSGSFVSILAADGFEKGSAVFQGINSGKVTYIDFSVTEGFPDDEVVIKRIEDGSSGKSGDSGNNVVAVDPVSTLGPREQVAAFARAVAQRMGPISEIEDSPFPIKSVSRKYENTPVVSMYARPGISMSPLKTYQAAGLYATVFLIVNDNDVSIAVDPQKIRGKWIALDLLTKDAELRAHSKTLITLFHVRALPNDVQAIPLSEALK